MHCLYSLKFSCIYQFPQEKEEAEELDDSFDMDIKVTDPEKIGL